MDHQQATQPGTQGSAKPRLVGARNAAVWRFVGDGFALFMGVRKVRAPRKGTRAPSSASSAPFVFHLELVIISTRS